MYWPKNVFKIFEKIGQNYDFFHPFSTTTQQGIENRGVAVMSRIAPIILKLYRYASILSSGYILVQEFASSTLTSALFLDRARVPLARSFAVGHALFQATVPGVAHPFAIAER